MPKHWWTEEGEDGHKIEDHLPFVRKREKKSRHRITRGQWIALSIIGGFAIIGVWLWIAIARGLPTLDQLENPHPELATQLISADGERLDQYYIKNRTTVELKDVPRDVIAALISTEDRDFYKHWGINLWGNIRAAWTDIVTLSPRQGASTITQQLARNLYLS